MPGLTIAQIVVWSIVATIAIELVTIFFRFVLDLEASRDTLRTVGRVTKGVRVHHCYLGGAVLMVAAAGLMAQVSVLGQWMLVLGVGLVFSDLIHHFLVLQWAVGHHEFHLVYPARVIEQALAGKAAVAEASPSLAEPLAVEAMPLRALDAAPRDGFARRWRQKWSRRRGVRLRLSRRGAVESVALLEAPRRRRLLARWRRTANR
jgi:hypothetical protein